MDICICDDNPVQMQYIEKFTRAYLETSAAGSGPFTSYQITPDSLDGSLRSSSFRADIIILDIRLGDLNGIDIARRINQSAPDCQIIFLTGYIDYAPLVYEAEHLYFVLKTQMEETLPKALEKAVNVLSKKPSCLTIHVANSPVDIPIAQIFYIEKMEHHSILVTASRKITATISLKNLEALLDLNFIRCHGSYIVNLGQVEALHGMNFQMKNGDTVPIGRTFGQPARKAYLSYLTSNL